MRPTTEFEQPPVKPDRNVFEVAATRSLANTAEMLVKNPALMKLKELEALERVAGRGASIIVAPETFGLSRELIK